MLPDVLAGYIGSQFWNQGRTEEIRDRVIHLGGDE